MQHHIKLIFSHEIGLYHHPSGVLGAKCLVSEDTRGILLIAYRIIYGFSVNLLCLHLLLKV